MGKIPGIGVPELVLVLVVIIMIFGIGTLTDLGGAIGRGIREFRRGVNVAAQPPPADRRPSYSDAASPEDADGLRSMDRPTTLNG
jgi:sec-independent protein translocase protein TatA